MYLTILEISQKQAYIFASNKLKDNITNSAVIANVLDPSFIEETLKNEGYTDSENMVYAGGGHTILEFEDRDMSVKCVSVLTEKIYIDFDGLQVFASTVEYDAEKSVKENLTLLTESLERKKALRKAFFHQGTYGVEKIDSNTLDVIALNGESEAKKKIREKDDKKEREFYPENFEPVKAFEDLGGSKNESNFIAVVHIDGNGMGKRVEELYGLIGDQDWKNSKSTLRKFSEGIDDDFKSAFKEMTDIVGKNIDSGNLKGLNLKGNNFPIRRVITAGDDICYVAEGRIGIESATVFIEALSKKRNCIDNKGYSACAGVALVHQKYPFYRAYELAEQLCSNAKSFGSMISPEDNGRSISSIDWHIEFGEMGNSLEEIRKNYKSGDGNELLLRPYIVDAPEAYMSNKKYAGNKYVNFKTLINKIKKDNGIYTSGKIKELRSAIKSGETASYNYLCFNRMEEILADAKPTEGQLDISKVFTGTVIKNDVFVKSDLDGRKHSSLFDAIEMLDTYFELERVGE